MFQYSPRYSNDRRSQIPCRSTTLDPFANHALDWSLADFADMTTPSDGITGTSDISLVDGQPLNDGPFKIPDSSVFSRSRHNKRSKRANSRGINNSLRTVDNSRRQKPCKFFQMIYLGSLLT